MEGSMFTDLDEFFDGDLRIPIKGRIYRVKEPTAREGLRLARFFADADNRLDDAAELAEIRKIIGKELWHEMADNRVPRTLALQAGRVAMIHYGIGEKLAAAYAKGGADSGNPLPPKPKRRLLRGRKSRI
jgi:hypothetical protein